MKLTHLVATAALTASLLGAGTVAANAATPRHENDLRTFCSSVHHVSCVADADNDEGQLVIRDSHGHRHNLKSSRAALRYLKHHATACREEDSARCVWDAGTSGNGEGDSYIVIGGKHAGQGTVWYLGNLD